jgi:uncharacterized protein YjbI with pentapeptide repeats
MSWRDVFGVPPRTAHDKWIERGRTGEGRVVAVDKNLDEARASGARLVAARFERCSFDRAVIEMSDFDEVEMISCRGANGSFVRNRMYSAHFADCTFADMQFWRLRLVGGRMERSTFTRCMFEEGFVIESQLTDTKFTGSNMRLVGFDRARVVRCDLREVDLTGATAVGAHFEDCDLRGAIGAALEGATFANCQRD